MRGTGTIVAVAVSAVAAGCAGGNGSEATETRFSVVRTLASEVGGALRSGAAASTPPTPQAVRAALTPDLVAALPGPTLLVVLEEAGAISLPVRVAVNPAVADADGGPMVETYRTEDAVTLSLRAGMVVATRGLGFDLMSADAAEPLAAILAPTDGGRGRATRVHAYLDGEGRTLRRAYDCRYAREPIAADGTVSVRETCYGADHRFENDYTIGLAVGLEEPMRIIASRQWLGPVHGHLALEQIRF